MGSSPWGGKRRVGGGCEWMALAWNGDVPLVGVPIAICLCHAIETGVFFLARYVPTTFPYHLIFQQASRFKRERRFPNPLPRENCSNWELVNEWTHHPRNRKESWLFAIRIYWCILQYCPGKVAHGVGSGKKNGKMDIKLGENITYVAGAFVA